MPADPPLVALPLVLPLLAAGVLVCLRGAGERVRHGIGIASCAGQLVAALFILRRALEGEVMVVRAGSWPAPFGIVLVADLLSAVMVLVTAVIGLVVAVYAAGAGTGKFRGYFPVLYQALLMGVNGSFLTGDLFNLYVWFEVMLMSSFVLVSLPGGRPQLEAGIKYLTLNFIASAFFLVGIGVLYGIVGTLNLADLSIKLAEKGGSDLVLSSCVLFLVAFGIKAGVFPFYFWLPASYHVTPTPVAAVFAGLLTKVGVYACMRVFSLVYAGHHEFLSMLLLPIGVLTMITGVFGAASQFQIPRILSFHIISQIGYMIVGIGFFTRGAAAATVFYIVHHILVKSNLFLIGGLIGRRAGTQGLAGTGGLYGKAPWLAVLFLIPAMSLGGIPPLSGFFAKFALVREGIGLGQWTVTAAALAVGLLTLFSMVKIWNEAFWKPAPLGERQPDRRLPWLMTAPCICLALCTVMISVFPEVCMKVSLRAADQLFDPAAYIQAVLGGSGTTDDSP